MYMYILTLLCGTEWAVGFYTELDFKNEAANMVTMAKVFADAKITDVAVPKVTHYLYIYIYSYIHIYICL